MGAPAGCMAAFFARVARTSGGVVCVWGRELQAAEEYTRERERKNTHTSREARRRALIFIKSVNSTGGLCAELRP